MASRVVAATAVVFAAVEVETGSASFEVAFAKLLIVPMLQVLISLNLACLMVVGLIAAVVPGRMMVLVRLSLVMLAVRLNSARVKCLFGCLVARLEILQRIPLKAMLTVSMIPLEVLTLLLPLC